MGQWEAMGWKKGVAGRDHRAWTAGRVTERHTMIMIIDVCERDRGTMGECGNIQYKVYMPFQHFFLFPFTMRSHTLHHTYNTRQNRASTPFCTF